MAPRARLCALVVSVLAFSTVALAGPSPSSGPPLVNWSAPATYSPAAPHSRIRALADVTNPLPFIGVTPCRIVDTRGPAGTFGGPSLPDSTPRNFPLPAGPCAGIPASVSAYSLNITVTNTLGPGFISIYPQGGPAPLVSTLNYLAGQTLANAAIVPAGSSGGVTVVAGVSGTDLIIDINGYYAAAAGNQGNTFKVINSGGATIPAIWGETTSSNLNATGVYGVASATTGITDGVWGRNYSSSDFSAGVLGISEGTTGLTFGVYGRTNSTSAGAVGTYGEAIGAGGATYGVEGASSGGGFDSAGVRGVDGGSPSAGAFSSAGTRGDSLSGFGVLGTSRSRGVQGVAIDSGGSNIGAGVLGYAGGPYGVFSFSSYGGMGAKYFIEPHPADPSKVIRYVCLEGPESGTYFRGSARIVDGGAVIPVPEDFRIVTDADGRTVQLTPVGAAATMYVVSEDLDRIVVCSNRDVTFHYMVNGVRKAYRDHRAIREGSEYMPESPSEKMPGYFTEEAQRRLISNGTYNADGTVNLQTAERLGWTKIWTERERETQAAVREARRAATVRQR